MGARIAALRQARRSRSEMQRVRSRALHPRRGGESPAESRFPSTGCKKASAGPSGPALAPFVRRFARFLYRSANISRRPSDRPEDPVLAAAFHRVRHPVLAFPLGDKFSVAPNVFVAVVSPIPRLVDISFAWRGGYFYPRRRRSESTSHSTVRACAAAGIAIAPAVSTEPGAQLRTIMVAPSSVG
jgi:hypothetical protein